ncbi:hypothetical protein [Rheinheimera pacifica]|uniref:hypothetical protein n=1 Tax=Rheinheimera pacifica TaxID=173990 RepID=UPI002EDA5C78
MGQSDSGFLAFATMIKDLVSHDYAFIIITILLFLWFTHYGHLGKALSYFLGRKKQRLAELSSYIANNGCYSELAQEEIEQYHFAQMTGLILNKTRRELLFSFQQKNAHDVYWGTIKRAMPHLDLDIEYCLKVKKIRFWTKVGFWLNTLLAFAALFVGVGLLVGIFISLLLKQITPAELAWMIFGFFLMMICAGFIYAHNWPLLAVKKIKTVLQNDEYVYTPDPEKS